MTEKPKLHKGVFCFMNKLDYNVHEMREVLKMYANSIGMERPLRNRLKWYSEVSEMADLDFKSFKIHFNTHKRQKNNVVFRKYSSNDFYDDLDDDFVGYNGIADDF
jgi:hypothetical protein